MAEHELGLLKFLIFEEKLCDLVEVLFYHIGSLKVMVAIRNSDYMNPVRDFFVAFDRNLII